jgi:hypothetical protein
MDAQPEPIDFVGYGAIYGMNAMIAAGIKSMWASVETGIPPQRHSYDLAVAMMREAMTQLRPAPLWDDARAMSLQLLARYQDLIDVFARGDWEQFREVGGEFNEMQVILSASLASLAQRLGLPFD